MTNAADVDILLVEDSPDDADLALHALRKENLTNSIYIARDGEEALNFIFCLGAFADRTIDHLPKLMLLDLKLPKVDGLQVLKAVKADQRTKSIPIVILTSSKEERDLISSYDLGVNSFIQKPVDFGKFRETVASVGLYWIVTNEPPIRFSAQTATSASPASTEALLPS